MKRTGSVPACAFLLACVLTLPSPGASAGQPPARRVVSLLPGATELIVALGAGSRLVGVGRHDEVGEGRLPRLGGPVDPALEAIAALRPDLVVVWADVTPDRNVRRLEALGSRVYGARIETLDDVARTARELGLVLGRGAAADSLARSIRRALDSLRVEPAGARPSVLVVLHPRAPFLTAGPSAYLDELIRIAGGRNAFADARVPWPRVSAEAVVARAPDVLVVPGEDADALLGAAPWRSLEAVEAGRVLRVPRSRLLRPGPGSVGLARDLARLLDGLAAGVGR